MRQGAITLAILWYLHSTQTVMEVALWTEAYGMWMSGRQFAVNLGSVTPFLNIWG